MQRIDRCPREGRGGERRSTASARADGDAGLWRAVQALPTRQRVVLVLRYYESLSDEEIARHLGITRGTVRSQAARGLDKLRADVRAQEPATRR